MSSTDMENVLSYVGKDLRKQTTSYRVPVEPQQRLAVTLRYLATGDSMHSLAYCYRLGIQTVSDCIKETCRAIEEQMLTIYLPKPTKGMWEDIALSFEDRWNFPNCIGALDGKHIYITAPPKSGSLFFNYKGSFSIVLLALVDANYKFIAIQVGDFGKSSDGGVYSNSTLGRAMKEKTLSVPEEKCLPGAEDLGRLPYVMVGDAAFPLKPYLMRPYPGKNLERRKANFNYRLSRARMTVEKAFGILSSRWRIFHRDINLMPETTDTMIVVTCILHNMLTHPGEAEHWLREASEVVSLRGLTERPNRGSLEASNVREKFADYFSSQAACF
ncbi:hypothetical protein R3I94_008810 [Phoxinus phoxinus]